jgi:hypothetical protein
MAQPSQSEQSDSVSGMRVRLDADAPEPRTSATGGRVTAPQLAVIDEGVRSFRPGLAVRLRILLACVALLSIVWAVRRPISPPGLTPEASLVHALERRGLLAKSDDVVWLDPPAGPLGLRQALVVAQRRGELPDISFVRVRAAESGRVLDVWSLTNVTRSSSAAESQLIMLGPFAAFAVQVGARYAAVSVLDTRGESAELTARWPARARAQNAITNLQDAGRVEGFGRVRYGLTEAPEQLTLSVEGDYLRLDTESGVLRIDPVHARAVEGEERVESQLAQKGQPGTITWVVDTVRNLSFVGAAPIEWLEHTVFGITDRATRAYYDVLDDGSKNKQAGEEARAALTVTKLPEAQRKRDILTAADPELRWPPAKIEPVLPQPIEGEGEWLPVIDADMVVPYPGAPPAFYQTFVRVDPERSYTRVYVTTWDPRQLQLNIAMGTQEPISATGETGEGQVPREPETLRRLVAGFNGGFQALHGEFGMMAQGKVYLPPKPYAATVAVHEDGRVGLGSWPGPGKSGWDEVRANEQIPSDMIAMRQNLTTVVEGDAYNPWKRWWWGAAPVFATEQTFIHRSGLCVTREGHMAYLWGESMGPDQLGAAMLAARCARGMHLDMNSKHTGLELYRTFVPGQVPPELSRKLDRDHEWQGAIEGSRGYHARAKLAVKTMTPLRFPRYLDRDPRDFFFLTQKSVLPGPALQVGGAALSFSTAGLPHAGWPNAFARARFEANDGQPGGAWLLRADLSRAVPKALAPEALSRPLAHVALPPPSPKGVSDPPGELALYVRHVSGLRRFAIGVPPEHATVLLRGYGVSAPAASSTVIALDAEGFLVYAEADEGRQRWLIQQLALLGLEQAMILPAGARLSLVTDTGQARVSGEAVPGASEIDAPLTLVAETRPPADVMFPEVEPKPYRFWGWLQGQRVRYFPQGTPRFKQPEEALVPGQTATAPAEGPNAKAPNAPNVDKPGSKPTP